MKEKITLEEFLSQVKEVEVIVIPGYVCLF